MVPQPSRPKEPVGEKLPKNAETILEKSQVDKLMKNKTEHMNVFEVDCYSMVFHISLTNRSLE